MHPFTFSLRASARYASALAILGLAASAHAWKPGDRATLRIANSQPNQSIYAIGVAYKNIIEQKLPGVRFEIIATQGGDENAKLMMAREAEIINANTVAPYSAHHGRFSYEGKKPDRNVLSFFPAYTWETGRMVPANSPVKDFRELVGKRVATGPVGSGVELTWRQTLEALGLKDDSFARVQRSAPTQGFNGMAANSLDAFFWGTAHPAGVVMEKAATGSLKFVSIDKADLAKIAARFPYYHAGELRANTYKGQTEAVNWVGGSTHFWVYGSLDQNLVYAIVKTLWENRETIRKSHSSQQYLDEDLVRQQAALLPFHPGAARYFKEVGILK